LKLINVFKIAVYIIYGLITIYSTIFCMSWMWRNPKANTMTCLRDFKHVIVFDKMETYQK